MNFFVIVTDGFVYVAKSVDNARTYLNKAAGLSATEAERLLSEASASGDATYSDKTAGKIVLVYAKSYFGTSFA